MAIQSQRPVHLQLLTWFHAGVWALPEWGAATRFELGAIRCAPASCGAVRMRMRRINYLSESKVFPKSGYDIPKGGMEKDVRRFLIFSSNTRWAGLFSLAAEISFNPLMVAILEKRLLQQYWYLPSALLMSLCYWFDSFSLEQLAALFSTLLFFCFLKIFSCQLDAPGSFANRGIWRIWDRRSHIPGGGIVTVIPRTQDGLRIIWRVSNPKIFFLRVACIASPLIKFAYAIFHAFLFVLIVTTEFMDVYFLGYIVLNDKIPWLDLMRIWTCILSYLFIY